MIKKIKSFFKAILIVIYIVFEELIWEQFARPIFIYLKTLKLFKKFEIILKKQNRYFILILFLLPFVLGELLGVVSAILIFRGLVVTSVIVYAIKLIVVAFSFWLFNVEKDKLLSFKIIDFSYTNILKFTQWVKQTEVFIRLKEKVILYKAYAKRYFYILKLKIFKF